MVCAGGNCIPVCHSRREGDESRAQGCCVASNTQLPKSIESPGIKLSATCERQTMKAPGGDIFPRHPPRKLEGGSEKSLGVVSRVSGLAQAVVAGDIERAKSIQGQGMPPSRRNLHPARRELGYDPEISWQRYLDWQCHSRRSGIA